MAATAEPPGVPLAVSVAILSPALLGLKCTTTVQVPAGASAAPQAIAPPVTISNWVGSLPPSAVVIAPVAAPPVLVTVNVKSAPVDMATASGKACGVGVMVSRPGIEPVPVNGALTVRV